MYELHPAVYTSSLYFLAACTSSLGASATDCLCLLWSVDFRRLPDFELLWIMKAQNNGFACIWTLTSLYWVLRSRTVRSVLMGVRVNSEFPDFTIMHCGITTISIKLIRTERPLSYIFLRRLLIQLRSFYKIN